MKVIIFLLFLVVFGYSQATVKAIPSKKATTNILNEVATYSNTATTSAIDASQWSGVATAYCYFDTAAAETPAAITISPQIYNSLNSQWYDYYDEGSMVSIASTVWDEDYVFINLGVFDDWAVGDSVRFVVTAANDGTVRIDIGGQ